MVGQSGLTIRGDWWLDGPRLELITDDDGGIPRRPGLDRTLR
jgi:hypothetical protein